MTRSIKESSGTQTKYEDGKLNKMDYRKDAPHGTRMSLPMDNQDSDQWGFPPGRTLHRLPPSSPEMKFGGNQEDVSAVRSLRTLPASIKDGGVD